MMNLTHTILMIKPTKFGYNLETARDNVYQKTKADVSNKEMRVQCSKAIVILGLKE